MIFRLGLKFCFVVAIVTVAAIANAVPTVTVIANRSLGFRVAFLAMAQNGKTLIVGDGRTIADAGSRVLLLNHETLDEKATTRIKADLPWSSHSVAVAPDQQHALVFNRYITLDTLATTNVLDLKNVVAEGNVRPEPFAISPDGKSALVNVNSYIDSKLDSLAVFDLKSGKIKRTIDLSGEQPLCNACFLDDREIAFHAANGHVVAVGVDAKRRRVLSRNGPRMFSDVASNSYMAVSSDGQYLVVSSYGSFVVLDVSREKEVFRKTTERGNAVPILGGRFLVYQNVRRSRAPLTPGGFYRPLFTCVRTADGKTMAEFEREGRYDAIIAGEDETISYGVNDKTVSRLRFQWGNLLQPDKPER
jgi:DNA-binding beta-propeller fold protein YncE